MFRPAPVALGSLAVAVLVAGQYRDLGAVPVTVAAVALAVSLLRLVVTGKENLRLLRASQRAATKNLEAALAFAESADAVAAAAQNVLLQALRERGQLRDHLDDVAELALRVGRSMGLPREELDSLVRAAVLRDVGKLAVPDAILHKPGPLDESEWGVIREHTLAGERILRAAPALGTVAGLVRSSHERYDGTGYPDRLAGEDIPLGARIVAVCDAFHAMTSERAYSAPRTADEALDELRRCSGSQFDPEVVERFCELAGGAPAWTLTSPSVERAPRHAGAAASRRG